VARPVNHPLLGAELRADRALLVIGELRTTAQAWADGYATAVRLEQPEEFGSVKFKYEHPDFRLLADTSVLIGDAIYNMRAALDYIVYALAVVNNKNRHVRGTQFPIEDSPDMFTARRTGLMPNGKPCARYLDKVPDRAVDALRKLQPFDGCKWTKTLRELSNPDKHRGLTALKSRSQPLPEVGSSEPITLPDGSAGRRVNVRVRFEVEIFFSKGGEPVLETLEALQRQVSATVDSFEIGFQKRKPGVV
jgi:hypothetical protein